MFWADEIAEKVIARGKQEYRVHDYKTPSGRIHVGALRGVVIHSLVALAIRAKGAKVNFMYGIDDYDPMDGFPIYLPETYRDYMGQPLSNIPSPEPGFKSFGHFYGQEFIDVFHGLGIKPNIIWSSDMYKAGEYNEAIRISLDKANIIRKIYQDVSGSKRPNDWHALSVICPRCGKIGTTRVYAWDGMEVSFVCESNMVSWAKGCTYEGKISPFDGNAKLPWKVEWAAKWYIFENDFETAGKDHMTKNGSFDVAAEIVKQVFGKIPPIGRDYPYEWLLVGGKKMSSSKGTGASAKDVASMLPSYLLHFFIAQTRPNRHLNFEPSGMTMPLLFDDYDRAIIEYHNKPESDMAKLVTYVKATNQVIPTYTMRFSKVAFLSQMPNIDIFKVAQQENGAALSEEDMIELKNRIEYAGKWLTDFAPEEMRFVLQSTLPTVDLSDKQKQFLVGISDYTKLKNLTGADLHEHMHKLKTDLGLSPKEAFGAIYQVFLDKSSGPQAGWFLTALDRNFVLKRLSEAVES